MNIKINKEQASILFETELTRYLVGSRLYGIIKEASDTDVLVIYDNRFMRAEDYYPVHHQFQYDDPENNIQYIFSSQRQFWYNLFSGDSTINADVVLFSEEFSKHNNFVKLNLLRTYNIIKAYLGFAKRDLKDLKQGKGKNKLFHIRRGLHCAKCLLSKELPKSISLTLYTLDEFNETGYEQLVNMENHLRKVCNELYQSGELTMYPKIPMIDKMTITASEEDNLDLLLMNSMNIKEFTY